MDLQHATKHHKQYKLRGINGLSINQLGKESNSLKIGLHAGRVNTHHAMDKQKLSKIPKGKLKYDLNPFSFIETSFYSIFQES